LAATRLHGLTGDHSVLNRDFLPLSSASQLEITQNFGLDNEDTFYASAHLPFGSAGQWRRSGLSAYRNNGIKVMTVMYTRASTGHQRNENLGEEDSMQLPGPLSWQNQSATMLHK